MRKNRPKPDPHLVTNGAREAGGGVQTASGCTGGPSRAA